MSVPLNTGVLYELALNNLTSMTYKLAATSSDNTRYFIEVSPMLLRNKCELAQLNANDVESHEEVDRLRYDIPDRQRENNSSRRVCNTVWTFFRDPDCSSNLCVSVGRDSQQILHNLSSMGIICSISMNMCGEIVIVYDVGKWGEMRIINPHYSYLCPVAIPLTEKEITTRRTRDNVIIPSVYSTIN